MKTLAGYETDGIYIKFKSGFTGMWKVETDSKVFIFKTENEADNYITEIKKHEKNKIRR